MVKYYFLYDIEAFLNSDLVIISQNFLYQSFNCVPYKNENALQYIEI